MVSSLVEIKKIGHVINRPKIGLKSDIIKNQPKSSYSIYSRFGIYQESTKICPSDFQPIDIYQNQPKFNLCRLEYIKNQSKFNHPIYSRLEYELAKLQHILFIADWNNQIYLINLDITNFINEKIKFKENCIYRWYFLLMGLMAKYSFAFRRVEI